MGVLLNGQLNNSVWALAENDYDALIGVETATGYYGLSTFSSDFVITMLEDNTLDNCGYEVQCGMTTLFVPHINYQNVIKLSEHTLITDKEQTVIDMIRYNRHEFHLFETLVSAIDSEQVDVERLNNLAKQYGIYDKMYKLLDEALEAEEEDGSA